MAYEKTVVFIDSWRRMWCMVGENSGRFVPTKPSVAKQYPEILHEWNDDLDPNTISLGSNKKINWKCKEGHEWVIAPCVRFRNNRIKQCPECRRGPSLDITHPEILVDWNDERDPADFTFGTGKQVLWKCHKCEHEWSASPNNRIKKGKVAGCPCCVGGRLHSDGINSLENTNPELAEEWNFPKNGDLTPKDVTSGSEKSVWWVCKNCDNEWKTNIYNRKVNGCPSCNLGRLHSNGINSLQMVNPKLASEWHPTKNGNLKPTDVVANTNKKVWWYCDQSKCEHPHEWIANINARTGGSNCPFCYGNTSFCPCDSIVSTHPELVEQIHPDENINPEKIVAGSDIRIKWLCKKSTCEHEHVWSTQVKNRALHGHGCPYCAIPAKKVCECNSFGAIFPEWVEMWSEKNGDKTPYQYTPHSSSYAWWQCPVAEDHLWKGKISDRTRKNQNGGCPFCAGKRLSKTNCLANTHPEIASQWHPTKNGSLKPSEVTNGSHKRVWWKCPEGPDHEWSTKVGGRVQGNTGCPFCAGQKTSITNCLATTMPELAKEWHPTKNGDKTPNDFTKNSNKKVWWLCKKCDFEWVSIIGNRAKGRGCQQCAETGFNPDEPAYFYAMEIAGPTGVWWYKGGISSDPNHRRYQVDYSLRKNGMSLEVKLLQTLKFEMGKDAKDLESKLLAIDEIRVTTVEKFDGSKELFNTNPIEYANENELLPKQKSPQRTLEDFF